MTNGAKPHDTKPIRQPKDKPKAEEQTPKDQPKR